MVVTATLLLSACGKATEAINERAIEAQTGGSVDISDDGDSISFESGGSSGSISIQSDEDGDTGTLSGIDAEGNEFSTKVGGTEVPGDFPMPIFEPSAVTGVITNEASVGTAFIIQLEIIPGDADALLGFYEDWFAGEGMATLDAGLAGILANSDTISAAVSVLEEGGEPAVVILSWTPIG